MLALSGTIIASGKSFEGALACTGSSGKSAIVSAEKVWERALPEYETESLVNPIYAKMVQPVNPEASTPVGKWGSSFYSWCLSQKRWESAFEFYWVVKKPHAGMAYGFPLLWDKRPDLCGHVVCFYTLRERFSLLPVKEFDAYLKAATQWVNPGGIDLETIRAALQSTSVTDVKWGLRLAGAAQKAEAIPLVGAFVSHPDFTIRKSAVHALGLIGHQETIPYVLACVDDKYAPVAEEVAQALGRIGGNSVIPSLQALTRSANPEVRRAAASALGDAGSKSAIGILYALLGDKDLKVSETALRSLRKLGWKPKGTR